MLVDYHTLWTLRNGKCHGTNKKAQCINRLAQLKWDLLAIYKYEPEVLACDKDLFDSPIDKILDPPSRQNRRMDRLPPPHPTPKLPQGQMPQHVPCPPPDILSPAAPLETKMAYPTTQSAPSLYSHCQYTNHLILALDPHYPHPPAPSCPTTS
jgi:hypothetical protein